MIREKKSMYTVIDMKNDPRREQYALFTGYRDPILGITVRTDVTRLAQFCRERRFSFYAGMTRVATVAANRVRELRRRIHGDEVREYDLCSASITELAPSGVYYYCTLHPQADWDTFIACAEAARAAKRQAPSLEEDEDVESQFLITCTPTLCYEQLKLPGTEGISNPMISWGKYEEDWRGRLMMPLTLSCHHALADGLHVAAFYRNVEEELSGLPLRS